MSWGEGENRSFENRVLSYKQVLKFAERGRDSENDTENNKKKRDAKSIKEEKI